MLLRGTVCKAFGLLLPCPDHWICCWMSVPIVLTRGSVHNSKSSLPYVRPSYSGWGSFDADFKMFQQKSAESVTAHDSKNGDSWREKNPRNLPEYFPFNSGNYGCVHKRLSSAEGQSWILKIISSLISSFRHWSTNWTAFIMLRTASSATKLSTAVCMTTLGPAYYIDVILAVGDQHRSRSVWQWN